MPARSGRLSAPAAKARSTSAVTSTPKTLPSRLDEEVLRRPGRPCMARISVLAGDVGRQARGRRSRVRATALTGTQGRRSSGVASSAASLTIADGRPSRSSDDDAAGLRLLGAAYRLGQRQVVGDREGTAGQGAGLQRRQPAADPRAT